MCHAFHTGYKTDLAPLLPTGIYTIPEVSMVGAAEEDLKSKGVNYVVERTLYAHCAAARSSAIRSDSSSCCSVATT